MTKTMLYFHGKGGSADETALFRSGCAGYDLVGVDYEIAAPWVVAPTLRAAVEYAAARGSVSLLANSIGAYLAMQTLAGFPIERAYFISPILDMERLIGDMLGWAGATETTLREKREIETGFGETLSWDYLCYVRAHPLDWRVPTEILYGEGDTLTRHETVDAFVRAHGAGLTVLKGGEHWFHTPEQLAFANAWLRHATGAPEA